MTYSEEPVGTYESKNPMRMRSFHKFGHEILGVHFSQVHKDVNNSTFFGHYIAYVTWLSDMFWHAAREKIGGRA